MRPRIDLKQARANDLPGAIWSDCRLPAAGYLAGNGDRARTTGGQLCCLAALLEGAITRATDANMSITVMSVPFWPSVER